MVEIKEEKPTTIFESIEFIFRHPWLFLSPIIVVMSVVSAQLSMQPLNYRAQALVSFESVSDFRKRENVQKIEELTQKLLVGESAAEIVKDIKPGITEKDDPGRFRSLRNSLRGVNMKYDFKVNLLTISFISGDPKFCHKVVEATVSGLERELKKTTKRRLAAGLGFLTKQEDYYKNKIKEMGEEISRIKAELRKRSSELGEEERILVGEITGESDLALRDQTVLQKLAKYDELIAELQLQLLDAEKRKKSLDESLRSGEFPKESKEIGALESDEFIKQYDREIANKELEIANLLSQGYLPEHPLVKKLESEIRVLEQLKKRRFETLDKDAEMTKVERSESAKKEAEEIVREKLEEVELEIETLKGQIDLMTDKYKSASPQAVVEPTTVSSLATRLKELKEERTISQKYYHDIRRELEEAKLKTRVEEEEAGLNLIVVEKPYVPSNPIPFQKTPKMIWGLIVSLLIGSTLAYTAESFDNSIKSAAELRELLHTPILGSIDRMNTVQEIRIKVLRRNAVLLGLIGFALSAKFLLKFRLFQLIFNFLK